MVLSNKRQKLKARAEAIAKLVASAGGENPSYPEFPDPNSQTNQPLKEHLDSATPKPRLSKREKKRVAPASTRSSENGGSCGGAEEEKKKDDPVSGDGEIDEGKKKKKKKRKRDDGDGEIKDAEGGVSPSQSVSAKKAKKKKRKRDDGDGEIKDTEGGVSPSQSVSAKKAKKKKKKKKKKGKKNAQNEKARDEEQIKVSGTEEVGNEEQGDIEPIALSNGQENAEASSTKVYVGGIPFYSTEDDIYSFFEGCGTVTEVDCMKFPDSGKFNGIAILSFKTEAAAKRALALDGADMGGMFLKIQPYKTTRSVRGSNFAPKMVEGYNRIYLGNLSWDVTEDDVKKFLSDCNISSIRMGTDKETKEFKGYAHVDFSDHESVAVALKLDQTILCERPVKISCAVPKKTNDTQSKSKEPRKKPAGQGKSGQGENKTVTCYGCGESGHISSACPKKQVPEQTSEKADGDGADPSSGKKKKRRTCYECGVPGHLSLECPKNKAPEAN